MHYWEMKTTLFKYESGMRSKNLASGNPVDTSGIGKTYCYALHGWKDLEINLSIYYTRNKLSRTGLLLYTLLAYLCF